MTYSPENLNRWTRPVYYFGAEWPEYFVFLGRTRDSDLLTESNFHCALESLGGESETVKIVRESHWACGWVEWIAIHESDARALELADSMAAALADYPVLNGDDYSEREYDAANEFWESLSIRERAEYAAESGESIFSARRDYPTGQTLYAMIEVVQ